jgi:hypothetical protein
MLKIPAEYDRDTSPAKLKEISRTVSPCFAIRSIFWYLQITLVDESAMIRTQIGTHNKSENGRIAWDALYNTAP